jgi:hypothetical protein
VSQNDSDMVPVMDSVSPDAIPASVSGYLHFKLMHGNSVSVDSDLVSLEGNSVGGYHIFFLSDCIYVLRNLILIGVCSLEFNSKRMSQTVNDMTVLDDKSSEVMNSVDMNLDGSSVDNDFMSESVNFLSVSVDGSGVSHDLMVLIIAIELSSLRNRGQSKTRYGQQTNEGN